MDIREKFVNQAQAFEPIFNDVFGAKRQADDEDATIALLLFDQAESPEKADLTGNIDNLEKVFDVVQLQTEMMIEFVRATVGPILSNLTENENQKDDEILPMLMFVHEKMIKLHNQLDFFFSSFEEEDLKKGFSIARRSATSVKFNKNPEKDQVIAFIRNLRSKTTAYLKNVSDLHDWLHGMLDILDGELNKNTNVEA